MSCHPRPARRLCVESLENRRLLALLVDSHLDVVDAADGVTTLREAINAANSTPGAEVIDFDPSLAGKTIQLATPNLAILDSLTVNGLGADQLTIKGAPPSGVFNHGPVIRVGDFLPIGPEIDVIISGLTITGGRSGYSGAGIRSTSNLTVVDCVVSNNSVFQALSEYTTSQGGGIAAMNPSATTSIIRTVIADNEIGVSSFPSSGPGLKGGSGGGIFAAGTLNVVDSVITRNRAGTGSVGYRHDPSGAGGDGGGIYSWGVATISGSVITDNHAGRGGNGGGSAVYFGRNAGAGGDGGGIAGAGTLTIIDSVIANNSSGQSGLNGEFSVPGDSGRGGGVYFASTAGLLSVSNSTIADNSTPDGEAAIAHGGRAGGSGDGGGLWVSGQAAITGSTISGNYTGVGGHGFGLHIYFEHGANSGDGGGLWLGGDGAKSIINSTISGNRTGAGGNGADQTNAGNSGNGGGLWFGGSDNLSIVHSTVTNNETGEAGVQSATGMGGVRGAGGGAFNAGTAPNVSLNHTIVAGNRRGAFSGFHEDNDLAGAFAARYSLIGVNTDATITDQGGSQIGTAAAPIDPMLGQLADNGGPTHTHALLAGSPALNSGDPLLVGGVAGAPETDQRGVGFPRVAGASIDIGAFEAAAPPEMQADFDGDADVDGHDFLAWQRGEGDANGDGNSDHDDLEEWMGAFGEGEEEEEALALVSSAAWLSAAPALAASLNDGVAVRGTEEPSRDEARSIAFASLPVTAPRLTKTLTAAWTEGRQVPRPSDDADAAAIVDSALEELEDRIAAWN